MYRLGTYAVFRDFEVHTRFGTYAVWEGYIRGMGRYIRGMGRGRGGLTRFEEVDTGTKNDSKLIFCVQISSALHFVRSVIPKNLPAAPANYNILFKHPDVSISLVRLKKLSVRRSCARPENILMDLSTRMRT